LALGLEYLGRVTNKRCVAFLVSDFIGGDFERPMRILGQRHDVIAVSITDPRELSLPKVGLVALEDAETGDTVLLDTNSGAVRKRYEQLGQERQARLRTLFASMDVDHIAVRTDRDYVRDLVRFFRAREKRF
jgi:uncharacterized protein (DUF58 family)